MQSPISAILQCIVLAVSVTTTSAALSDTGPTGADANENSEFRDALRSSERIGSPNDMRQGQIESRVPLHLRERFNPARGAPAIQTAPADELMVSYVASTLWSQLNDVEVVGNYAYCAMAYGLVILDVTNPAAPLLVSQVYLQGVAGGVAVAGNYAYVADGASGLQIVNVSNPAAPVLAGSYDTPGEARGVAVAGTYAYVADGYYGLQIVNVSNPAAPVLAGSYDTPGYAYGVAVAGNYAYVADFDGFIVLSVSGTVDVDEQGPVPAQFHLAANYPNPFNPSTVIGFELSVPGPVQLQVYNVLGQRIATLVDRLMPAGKHKVLWDGRTESGARSASGVYLYRLKVGDQIETRKMMLLK